MIVEVRAIVIPINPARRPVRVATYFAKPLRTVFRLRVATIRRDYRVYPIGADIRVKRNGIIRNGDVKVPIPYGRHKFERNVRLRATPCRIRVLPSRAGGPSGRRAARRADRVRKRERAQIQYHNLEVRAVRDRRHEAATTTVRSTERGQLGGLARNRAREGYNRELVRIRRHKTEVRPAADLARRYATRKNVPSTVRIRIGLTVTTNVVKVSKLALA